MIAQLINIAQGFINATKAEFGVGNPDVETKATNRYIQCLSCPLLSDNRLRCDSFKEDVVVRSFYNASDDTNYNTGQRVHGCNCLLSWKVRSDSQCPTGRW